MIFIRFKVKQAKVKKSFFLLKETLFLIKN
ncbi:hypothetical protein B879_01174 [Cecembia lonarensis LW9]|uniref:Uncharacterized protein n=1 Tax=Cecembia lonarensis (strain CCUG 58316 / KCTC 22772 / LW9) TaxID=1225176 RepID=K1M1I7_CECL9|nr:hypothetical protein B879_01174 [Cecembia lonarensis LW9]